MFSHMFSLVYQIWHCKAYIISTQFISKIPFSAHSCKWVRVVWQSCFTLFLFVCAHKYTWYVHIYFSNYIQHATCATPTFHIPWTTLHTHWLGSSPRFHYICYTLSNTNVVITGQSVPLHTCALGCHFILLELLT